MEIDSSFPDSGIPESRVLLVEEISIIRSVLGNAPSEIEILRALSVAGNNPDRAINILLDVPLKEDKGFKVEIEKEPLQEEMDSQAIGEVKADVLFPQVVVKEEKDEVLVPRVAVKEEKGEVLMPQVPGEVKDDVLIPQVAVKQEKDAVLISQVVVKEEKGEILTPQVTVKEEKDDVLMHQVPGEVKAKVLIPQVVVKEEKDEVSNPDSKVKQGTYSIFRTDNVVKKKTFDGCDDNYMDLTTTHFSKYLNPRPIRSVSTYYYKFQEHVASEKAEKGEFLEEPNWFLVEKAYVTGLSTCRGMWKLVENEVVHFCFPKSDVRRRSGNHWVSAKTAAAASEIVRFSTKRSGEIGRLPTEWARCLIPLVSSSKVKVQGRCVLSVQQLSLMQEIVLYVSFYIHSSIFTTGDKSSWKLVAASQLDSTIHPLPTLFKLLKIKPFKKADFTPEELDTRKRSLILKEDDDDEPQHIVGLAKRRRGGQTYPEQSNDEQAVSESSLNKLVGAAEEYDLKEAEPPSTLTCELRPYQKQALYWMSELEKGIDVDQAAKTLHPCWDAYNISDRRASAVYVNVFSGEATTNFPSATQMARGGILADAMGLGKTVITIALILANPGRGILHNKDIEMSDDNHQSTGISQTKTSTVVKGGTLIVCPMALLGQWKDELETHSKPGSISVFVHYGGDRTNDPKVVADNDVVLTTYGVLASAYKSDPGKLSIFHQIEWYRVVIDEAHTIKSSKTRVAQSAFALVSHCRLCLTGTPLQNNLEDLYSLLCFLHVEPWCNWAWWHKLIQRPYESGDERGLRLVRAILRPLMLRRTKETTDKEGRPILVLPPVNVQVVECKQSEAERDFYDALFKKSKVRFDQFVAQGKVLHNYASILELLLRLRQCCNHPFLVMSRTDNQEYADLNKLARHFLEGTTQNSANSTSAPTRAYVEEVVEGIRRGEVTECPICLESASDDPVLTPCAHRMCRECLLSSWRTPSGGPCPICRKPLTKTDLITCPSESRFQVDVVKNWKESSKVTKLIECLQTIRNAGLGEKSIIFSQWTSFLDLLEIPLKKKNIRFLRFDGKLSQKQRETVLKEFSESTDKLVLLMSLKAGGVGLNLTAASNVFLMDPWWNPAVEEQAVMRIHRIGQKRQVRVRRFIVKDTVEERMQQVQARKQRMIAGALTDEEVRSARIEELKMLFR